MTDGPTDGPTNGQMGTPSYKGARTHLKIKRKKTKQKGKKNKRKKKKKDVLDARLINASENIPFLQISICF